MNNRIRDLYRKKGERPAGSSVFAGAAAEQPSPEDLFDKIWREEHLKQCLRLVKTTVEPASFEAFRMYALENLPSKTSARRWACPPTGYTPSSPA